MPSPGADVRDAASLSACCTDEPSPGVDVEGVSLLQVQMLQGCACQIETVAVGGCPAGQIMVALCSSAGVLEGLGYTMVDGSDRHVRLTNACLHPCACACVSVSVRVFQLWALQVLAVMVEILRGSDSKRFAGA
jgi:hypothetical protein